MKTKEELFYANNPSRNFIEYSLVESSMAKTLLRKLLTKHQFDVRLDFRRLNKNSIKFLGEIEESELILSDYLSNLLKYTLDKIFFSYCDFTTVYELRLSELDSHFDDIYYPVSDDVIIFDATCAWIMQINHDCEVYFSKIA